MRILALDSSGLVASVAVVAQEGKETVTVAEYTVNYTQCHTLTHAPAGAGGRCSIKCKKTHSQTLLPMLDEVVKAADLNLDEIDGIAVAAGPGSFTGLRIGSATAKGLGLALGKPLIHIPTLEGLAYNLWGTDKIICPILDARRGQVYTGIYEFDGDDLKVLAEQTAVDIEELGEKLKSFGRPVIFLGDGVPVHRDALIERIMARCDIAFAPANMNRQRAASVGCLAIQYYQAGKIETAAEHKPDYLRVSQAERERAEREQRQ